MIIAFYFQCIRIHLHLGQNMFWRFCAFEKLTQVFHDFFADNSVNFLFHRVFCNVRSLKPLHEFRNALPEIVHGSHAYGGTQHGRLYEPIYQGLHAHLMHVGFHIDVIHLPVLHLRVQLVVQEAHLHVGRQLSAPKQIFIRFVVRGAAHFY